MKKSISMLWVMVIALIAVPFAYADGSEDAGVTPDSLFWGVDKLFDEIGLIFSGSPSEKAEKGLEIARERLLEAKVMADRNKFELAEKAEHEHNKMLAEVRHNFISIDESDVESSLKIEQELNHHRDDIVNVKREIEFKVEGQMTEADFNRLNELIRSLESSSMEIEIELEDESRQTRTRTRTRGGDDLSDDSTSRQNRGRDGTSTNDDSSDDSRQSRGSDDILNGEDNPDRQNDDNSRSNVLSGNDDLSGDDRREDRRQD